MQKQKRGFWLFIFSLIPGAGEMYMGFKKQGISIMLLFWGVFAVGSCTGMDWLIFLIPIIWFYSFFNVHNLKSLSEEEFYSVEDSYVLHMDKLIGDVDTLLTHHRKLTAIVLIVFGASILWNNLVDFFYMILPGYLANVLGTFAYHLPQLVMTAPNVSENVDTANVETSANTADTAVTNSQPVSLKKEFSGEIEDTDNNNN